MHRIQLFESPLQKLKEISSYQKFQLTTYLSLEPAQLTFQTSFSKTSAPPHLGQLIVVEENQQVIFKGRLQKITPLLSAKGENLWQLEAQSLASSLNNSRVQLTCLEMPLSEMVKAILDSAQFDVTYGPATVAATYQNLSLTFDQTPARALNLIAELAGGYDLYVMDDLLYFQPPLSTPNKFWEYTPEKNLVLTQDSQRIINAISIRGARLADQTYLNFVKEDAASLNRYGRREKVILARNIADSFLADKLADLILQRFAAPSWSGHFLAAAGAYQLGDVVRLKNVGPASENVDFKINKLVTTTAGSEYHFTQGKGELQELIEAFTTSEETLELITISLNQAVNNRVQRFSFSGLQFFKNYDSATQTYEQGSLSHGGGYLYLREEAFPWYLSPQAIQPPTTPPELKDLAAHYLLYALLSRDNATTDANGVISHHSALNKIYASTLTPPSNDAAYYYLEIGRWDNTVDPARLTLINGGETTLYGDDLRVGTLNADLVNVESTAGSNAVHIGDITTDKGGGNRIILGNWVAQTGDIDANSGLLCKHANGDYTVLNASGLLLKSGSSQKRYLYNSLSGTLGWITDTGLPPDNAVNDPTGLGVTYREMVITVPDTSIKTANEWISSIIVAPQKTHPYQAGNNRTTNLILLNNARSAWVTVTPNDLEYVQETYTDIYVDNCVLVDGGTLKYYVVAGIQYALDNHPTAGYSYWGVGLDGGVRQIIWFLAI